MKAIVIHAHGGIDQLSYEEIATPEPGAGEVLVRVRAAGVNHFDHDIREGYSGHGQAMPHILGVEGAGEVAYVGPGRVVAAPLAAESLPYLRYIEIEGDLADVLITRFVAERSMKNGPSPVI